MLNIFFQQGFFILNHKIDSNSEVSADQREEEPARMQAEANAGAAAGENTRFSTRAVRVSDPVIKNLLSDLTQQVFCF
ncbi:MAG: hypothetical protein SPL22_13450 [Treponema sp.]|uniref:hypothetical protein n=1 Tax=Treponema sp. TaxID=166 RepID=UPI002A90E819|nr:hypothetical protein [Treponema sp.]MDY6398718.1 hypothetical protein [Treponema sp.]